MNKSEISEPGMSKAKFEIIRKLTGRNVRQLEGLEDVIVFSTVPDWGKSYMPSSIVYVFIALGHDYQNWILSNDVGCGMTAFIIGEIDVREFADLIAEYLKDKKILGRGNHFVDICSPMRSIYSKYPPHNLLIIHSDGKSVDPSIAKNLSEAVDKVKKASSFRKELGYKLSKLLSTPCEVLGDWPHNFVEVLDDKVIYRKGAIKVKPHDVHILPVHLGATIPVYTVNKVDFFPYSSMPHGTGRKGPRGKLKVDEKSIKEIKKMVYIPDLINPNSLRTEHPSCYNGPTKILEKFGDQILIINEAKILAYIGKI